MRLFGRPCCVALSSNKGLGQARCYGGKTNSAEGEMLGDGFRHEGVGGQPGERLSQRHLSAPRAALGFLLDKTEEESRQITLNHFLSYGQARGQEVTAWALQLNSSNGCPGACIRQLLNKAPHFRIHT